MEAMEAMEVRKVSSFIVMASRSEAREERTTEVAIRLRTESAGEVCHQMQYTEPQKDRGAGVSLGSSTIIAYNDSGCLEVREAMK